MLSAAGLHWASECGPLCPAPRGHGAAVLGPGDGEPLLRAEVSRHLNTEVSCGRGEAGRGRGAPAGHPATRGRLGAAVRAMITASTEVQLYLHIR